MTKEHTKKKEIQIFYVRDIAVRSRSQGCTRHSTKCSRICKLEVKIVLIIRTMIVILILTITILILITTIVIISEMGFPHVTCNCFNSPRRYWLQAGDAKRTCSSGSSGAGG